MVVARGFHAAMGSLAFSVGRQQTAAAIRLQSSLVPAWSLVTMVWMLQMAMVPFRAVRAVEDVIGIAVRIDDLPWRRRRRARGFDKRLVLDHCPVQSDLLFFPLEQLRSLFFSLRLVLCQRFLGTPDLFFIWGRERLDALDGDGIRGRCFGITDVAAAVDRLIDRLGRCAGCDKQQGAQKRPFCHGAPASTEGGTLKPIVFHGSFVFHSCLPTKEVNQRVNSTNAADDDSFAFSNYSPPRNGYSRAATSAAVFFSIDA
jgi:hypothetical protein